MSKSLFRLAFVACLSATGCASPFKMFAKKPQPFEEYMAQRKAEEQKRVASNVSSGANDVASLLNKGHAAFQQGNLVEAQGHYMAVLQQQPQNVTANHRLAVIADRFQDFNSAEHYYRAALGTNSRDPNLLNDAGYSLLLQSRFAEAEQYLQAALQQNPTHSNAINNMGLLYAKRGQPEQALALFRRTSSEAEAQAKLSRLTPAASNPGPVQSPGTMLAANPWGTSTAAPIGAPPSASPPGWNNPAGPATNGFGQPPLGTTPNANSFAMTPNLAGGTPNGTMNPSGEPAMTDAARQLREEMERARQRAVADRQARDLAERTRQESIMRQFREDEFGPSRVQPASGLQANDPRGTIASPGSPAVSPLNGAGSSGQSNSAAQPYWPAAPAPSSPSNFAYESPANAMPNVMPNTTVMPNVGGSSGSIPNSMMVAPAPNTNTPLDSMPTWPPVESLPAYSQPRTQFPANRSGTTAADDPARIASRLGMSAGPGNLFPMAPDTSATPSINRFPPNNSGGMAMPRGLPNGAFTPMTNEPPSGSFGPSNFGSPTNDPNGLPETPSRSALQGMVPPSEQYQTPNRFSAPGASSGINAQPTNSSSRGPTSGTLVVDPALFNNGNGNSRAPAHDPRAATPDRTNGSGFDRWEQAANPQGAAPIQSAPSVHGFLATPAGENSLTEYERMIQAYNAEANVIRQQIDAQRQLPGSENFLRHNNQPR